MRKRVLKSTYLFIFAVALLFINSPLQAQTGWTPDLEMKVRTVGAVRVSPDAKKVAYTISSAIMSPDKSEFVTQIWVANTDGSEGRQFTHAERSSDNPQWSPDGEVLAFTSARSGKSNIYVIHLTGGEAEQLTDVKSGVASFRWGPDSKRIAFVMGDEPTEDEEKAAKGKNDWRWIDEKFKVSRLYVIDLENAKGKSLPKKLSGDYNVTGDFDWSPDGKMIAFTRTKTPDDWSSADLLAVDITTGEIKTVTATGAAESSPSYSPDGKWIAYYITDDPPRWAGYRRIAIIPAGGGASKTLSETLDAPRGIDWSADGKRIYSVAIRGTDGRIVAIDVGSGAITEFSKGSGVIDAAVSLNQSRTMLGFAMQANDYAPEAFVSRVDNFSPVQISRANANLPKLSVGKTEVVRWRSADGMEIEGLLTYPTNYQPGRRVSLLLVIHGGPAGAFTSRYLPSSRGFYPLATFASRGFAILRANPRGSSGYGYKFKFANVKDWGGGDFKDLMTGVDHVIEMGVADPERLGVMGWSYGGYMTAWAITQTHRFKAASVGAGITNLISATGTMDISTFIPDYFEAQPWENLELYRARSAMFNVKGVTTPTLIQHGEADRRVPIAQAYELYNALKMQNVPVRMIVLPRMPHAPNEPRWC